MSSQPRALGRRAGVVAALTSAAVAGAAVAAQGQALQLPRRAAEVTAPRTSDAPPTSSLVLNGTVFGGYDDNVSQGGDFSGTPGPPPLLSTSGTVGQFALGLGYRRGRGRSGIDLDAQGSMLTYGGGIDVGSSQSADLIFGAHTGLGRTTMLNVSQGLTYDTTYGLGTLNVLQGPATGIAELPTSSAVEGVVQQTSWASNTALSLDQQLSRRDTAAVGYNYARRTFTGSNGETSASHSANAGYSHSVSRTTSLSASYAYAQSEYAGSFTSGPRRPVDSHNVEGSVGFTKRVTPRRSARVGFGGGAMHVETVSTALLAPYSYWAPTYNVDARLDLSPTWALSGNLVRTTSGFEGISGETFLSDVGGVSVGGAVGSRVILLFSGGGAHGNVDPSAQGSGSYTTVTGATQLSVRLTRSLSATAQYTYYRYAFSEDTELPSSLPPRFNRNAVNVGLTLALPLAGRQVRPPS